MYKAPYFNMKHLLLFSFLSWLRLVDVCSFCLQVGDTTRKNVARKSCYFHAASHVRSISSLKESSRVYDGDDTETAFTFNVRKAKYKDLRAASDILLDAFYSPSAVIRPYLFLSELSRLQGNFPYDNVDHSFFVAYTTVVDEERGGASTKMKEKIIGFVDVDARPGTRINDAPRPYLSDLAVHKDYKRKGVATSLIKCCEDESIKWGKENLYLRVEQKNDGALKMYSDLGYDSLEHPYFGVKDTTILLMKYHQSLSEVETPNGIESRVENTTLAYVI